jgi:hypothetical protein
MAIGEVLYRAEGGVDFKFRFVWMQNTNTWRIYILQGPSYNGRPTNDVKTHRLGLPNNPYICWDAPIPDYEDARWIASVWANSTMIYIRTGDFPPPPRQRANPGDRSVLAGHSENELRAALIEGARRNRHTGPRPAPTPVGAGSGQPGPIRRLLERIR